MASSFFARIGIIFTAFSAAMLSILGIVMLVVPPNSLEGPASYLPKEETLLLLHAETNDTVEKWGALFPELDQIPVISEPTDIAVLEMHCETEKRSLPSPTVPRSAPLGAGAGVTKAAAANTEPCERGWVVFQETSNATDATGGKVLGRFTVHSSSPALLDDIKPGSDRLTEDALVRIFIRTGTEYLFVRAAALPKSTDPLESTFVSWIPKDSSLLLSWNASGGTLTMPATLPSSSPIGQTIEASRASKLILRAAGLQEIWQALRTNASTSAWQLLEAKANTIIERHLGQDISFTYDVLPLLSQPFTFEERTGSGGLRFLLTGSDEDRAATEMTLQRMKASVRKGWSSVVIDERIFDERFRSTILKRSMYDLEEEMRTQEGWAITLIGTGHDGFAFGTRGNQFMLSDDPDWLLLRTKDNGDILALPGEGSAVAGGRMNVASLPVAPQAKLLKLIFPSEGYYRFVLRQRGANLRLEWQKEGHE